MKEAVLVEVKSGKMRHEIWRHIYINDEGYLFVPDKNGVPVLVQLVNWQWMPHEVAKA